MWLAALGLAVGGLGIFAISSREWRAARSPELGWMSSQWLAEHRASGR